MSRPPERLYPLLPAVYRMRDAAIAGQPLRAFVGLLDEQLQLLGADIAGLYENWFIETCDEWVVPYIGDLLAVRGLNAVSAATRTQRAVVANTIGYRRRKGTALALEKLAQNVTGWPAHVVEYFQLLATTAHLNHPRPSLVSYVDLRDTASLDELGSAFERTAHIAEVRHISSETGRYNIPYVGIHLWRLVSDYSEWIPATEFSGGRYFFSPLGCDTPLFNIDRTVPDFSARSTETDVPGPLRRRPLYDELEAWRASVTGSGTAQLSYFRQPGARPVGPQTEPVIAIKLGTTTLAPEEIEICDLSGDPSLSTTWTRPASKTFTRNDATHSTFAIRAAVDPVCGRLALAASEPAPGTVSVRFATGFPAYTAGGYYSRTNDVPSGTTPTIVHGGQSNLATAIAAALPAGSTGVTAVLEIVDSDVYTVAPVSVPARCSLVICAKSGHQPVLSLASTWTVALADASSFTLSGALVIGGGIRFQTTVAELAATATLAHCTLVPGLELSWEGKPEAPGLPSIDADPASKGDLTLSISEAVLGPIALTAGSSFRATVSLADAVVDAMGGSLAAIACDTANAQRVTVLGKTHVSVLEAVSDTIFTDTAIADRTQQGCVRFSYVPAGSKVPRAYRCQPSEALANATAAGADASALASISARVVPSFNSVQYRDPDYVQLQDTCAPEILQGASDGSEMGAYAALHDAQREANLKASLDEYLPFGVEAGFFHAT
jgi:hypothetical protein